MLKVVAILPFVVALLAAIVVFGDATLKPAELD